ncbi:uncharacterized protein LTR77_009618 [Saxophila tyrrhenica]|uniref:Carboxylic ester hydrolase n=1 Tax=Saxophila tyrrhenica TaxID=1690608 RepID=A0AAV9NY55_9PEZI|nr:hypothetical protein LTR77_009618 [Saxophila tyrrhenica]
MKFLTLAALSTETLALAVSETKRQSSGAPTVTVKNGTISGVHSNTYDQDYFLGIPYAQPPVNELRFRNPQSLNTTYDSTLQATEYAPECVGYGGDQIGYPVSEDCLVLNVVRPSGCDGQDLPLGVWIHGGGLYMGGATDERYNLSFIVQNSVDIGRPIIGVSIAYRLSAWGFLQSQEVSGSGNTNMGLRDQRLALHWIHENIGAFGGDCSKVTIWGESAGAASVGWHLMAYNGRDDNIFRAAIMESGNPVPYNSYRDNTFFQPKYDHVVKAAGCAHSIDTLDCLRSVPYKKLNNLFNTSSAGDWQPIVDGDFVAKFGSIQLAQGDFVKVPIMDGANTDEGVSFGPMGVNSTQDFIDFASSDEVQATLPRYFAEMLPDVYPNEPEYWIPGVETVGNYTYTQPFGKGHQYQRSAAYFGDVVMIANRRGACQAWAAAGVPAYCYRFNTRPAGSDFEVGVTHFQEVAFVFDNTQGVGYNKAHGTVNPFQGKPQSYQQLAKLMSSSWASFIATLDPNGFEGRYAQAEAWPKYSVEEPQNIVWDANTTALAYAEPDTFRQEGIQWILDHALAYHR